jgi:hypothetical protein
MHGVAMHGGGGEVGVSELFWFVVPLRHSGGGGVMMITGFYS